MVWRASWDECVTEFISRVSRARMPSIIQVLCHLTDKRVLLEKDCCKNVLLFGFRKTFYVCQIFYKYFINDLLFVICYIVFAYPISFNFPVELILHNKLCPNLKQSTKAECFRELWNKCLTALLHAFVELYTI